MVPNNYIKSYFVPFRPKNDQYWKMAKSEARSNIPQNDCKWSLMVVSSHILAHFIQKVDQKCKMAKSEAGSNMSENDSKWSLIVISSHILVQYSQKVDQN